MEWENITSITSLDAILSSQVNFFLFPSSYLLLSPSSLSFLSLLSLLSPPFLFFFFVDPLHPIEKLIENTYKQVNNSIVLLWLAQPLVDLLGSLSCVLSSPLPSTNTTSEEEVSEDAKEEVKEVVKEEKEDERERENAHRQEEAQQKDDTKAVVLADQGIKKNKIKRRQKR